jgi:hypothetical protein
LDMATELGIGLYEVERRNPGGGNRGFVSGRWGGDTQLRSSYTTNATAWVRFRGPVTDFDNACESAALFVTLASPYFSQSPAQNCLQNCLWQ